jgi:hypothetical protein
VYAPRRRRRLGVISLLLALITLGVLIFAYLDLPLPGTAGLLMPSPTAPAAPRPTRTATSPPSESPTRRPSPSATPNLSLTPFEPATPADQWAAQVLAAAVPLLQDSPPQADGLLWWQASNAGGLLDYEEEMPTLANRPLSVDDLSTISIWVPDPTAANRLIHLGAVTVDDNTLTLVYASPESPYTESRWLVSMAQPSLALRALAMQAERQDIYLEAAYVETTSQQADLALIRFGWRTPSPTAPLPSPAAPTPTAPNTATPTVITLTPTRAPEALLGRLVGDALDPVINTLQEMPPDAIQAYNRHPWTGTLTWTETGAEIDGRHTAVSLAADLDFYTLSVESPSSPTTRFMSLTYDGRETRLPDEQVRFQGQRMDEALFWMVRRAAERGGQLIVAYDDFGARQVITVIDFRAFEAES